MAELHMYQQDIVSTDISSYVLIITKYTKNNIFFDPTTVKKKKYHEVFCLTS